MKIRLTLHLGAALDILDSVTSPAHAGTRSIGHGSVPYTPSHGFEFSHADLRGGDALSLENENAQKSLPL
jgi:hypothetical protein